MKIAVLGDGAWGSSIAILLSENGHKVSLWGAFPENIDEMRKTRKNSKFLPGVKIPDDIKLDTEISETVSDASVVIFAIPSQFVRQNLKKLKTHAFSPKTILVNVAKGIENESLKRMNEVFRDELGGEINYCALSGPSHAEEVSRGQPTAVVAASEYPDTAPEIQKIFMNKRFRVYTSADVIGVELGGSLKNVFAIAAGIADGMMLGDNPKAALLTRSIAELSRFGTSLGGRPETFSGLSGIGDLIVTCFSKHSRNRFVGEELGKGRKLDDIIRSMGMVVAEGVKTAKSAYDLAKKTGIDTPIINEVYAGLYCEKDPHSCVSELMTRKAKSEF
jgi:glycerol-3-phosphate dehydrogenase (NAD(P)+)